MNAEREAVAVALRQFANDREISGLDGGQNAVDNACRPGARTYGTGIRGKLRGIEVAVCINPRRHTAIIAQAVQHGTNRDTV
jgi:hypothetical protein